MEKIWIKKHLYIWSYEFLSLYPFLDFYFIFLNFTKCILSLKNRKKWGFIRRTAGLTWHTGARKTDWRGTRDPRGCNAAHKATWQSRASPHEAQVAHRARTRGRRPRGSTQVHADAREGRHVVRRVGEWRAHGLVGPGYRIGAVTHLRYAAPPYIIAKSAYFLRCGTIFPRSLLLQVTWMNHRRWLRSLNVDRVDPSPRDLHQSTCSKKIISELQMDDTWCGEEASIFINDRDSPSLTKTYQATRGCFGSVRISSTRFLGRSWCTVTSTQRGDDTWTPLNASRCNNQIGWLEWFVEEFHAIAARSHRNRGSIAPRSWHDWTAIMDHLWEIVAYHHVMLVAHELRAIVATNRHPIADQTAQIFQAKIPFKTDVLLIS